MAIPTRNQKAPILTRIAAHTAIRAEEIFIASTDGLSPSIRGRVNNQIPSARIFKEQYSSYSNREISASDELMALWLEDDLSEHKMGRGVNGLEDQIHRG